MYYSKDEIYQYIEQEKNRIKKLGIDFIDSMDKIEMNLKNEKDLVSVFWLEAENGEINMNGKAFFRIDSDLYTDDRFAIDLFIALENNTTVSDVIKARKKQKESMKSQQFKHISDLYNILLNKSNNEPEATS